METTKQEIRNYFFGNIFPFEDEVEFTIRGEKADLFEAIELCVNLMTTSQKQTIERLREGNQILKKALNIIIGFEEYRGRVGCTYGDTEFDSMAAEKGYNDCLDYVKSIASTRLKEAEQLLNTTEPNQDGWKKQNIDYEGFSEGNGNPSPA